MSAYGLLATTVSAARGTTASRPERWSEEQLVKMQRFAAGRVTAERFGDPDEGFADVWAPKVAGMYIRISGQPHHGYREREEALAAGEVYREACRKELVSLGDGASSASTANADEARDIPQEPLATGAE